MTIPDETCTLDIYKDSRLGYIKENVINVNEMDCSLENINICFISYFAFISEQFAGPNISKSKDMTNVTRPSPGAKPSEYFKQKTVGVQLPLSLKAL